jgi:phosphate transport system protein
MTAADFSPHTSRGYNQELEGVRSQVLAMGGLVEDQLKRLMVALIQADIALGRKVAAEDSTVNSMELAIDEACIRILATRAPTARDLRLVVAIIKASTDLERIGDECQKLGHISAKLATLDRPAERYRDIETMGHCVQATVRAALNAFAHLDAVSALETVLKDRGIDQQYEKIQGQCVADMRATAIVVDRALEMMWAVRSLERIGDHAKNICEYVIYTVHGMDIRHISLDLIAEKLAPPGATSA